MEDTDQVMPSMCNPCGFSEGSDDSQNSTMSTPLSLVSLSPSAHSFFLSFFLAFCSLSLSITARSVCEKLFGLLVYSPVFIQLTNAT